MDKCIGCLYYDRQASNQNGLQWGQCRRAAPMLHPINQKSYMIEGVWPHVRDDDWCGEWKAAPRRTEARPVEASSLMQGGTGAAYGPRSATISALPGAASTQGPGGTLGSLMSGGRGD